MENQTSSETPQNKTSSSDITLYTNKITVKSTTDHPRPQVLLPFVCCSIFCASHSTETKSSFHAFSYCTKPGA